MFTINREWLGRELVILQSVAEKKGTIPVLQFALFSFDGTNLVITATDLDVTLVCQIPAEGESWSGCVPLKPLASLVRLFSGDVRFTPKPKDRIEVTSGTSKHLLPSLPATSFPATPVLAKTTTAVISGPTLREGLARVLPCVTTEESRYTLAGVQFETKGDKLQLVATDSHRLGVAELPCETEMKVLIPLVGIRALARLESESVEMESDTNHARFKCDHRILITRLLVGQFPNWEMIVPKALPNRVEVNADDLAAAIKRASLTRAESYKVGIGRIQAALKFTLTANCLTVESVENDKGQSTETVSATSNLNGTDYPLGMNPDYILDFLAQAEGQIVWEMKDGDSQQLLTADGMDFKYVVMPTRL